MTPHRHTQSVRRSIAALAIAAASLTAATGVAGTASAAPATESAAISSALTAATPTASGTDVLALLAQANAALKKLGIQPFLNPTVAFNCVAPTASNPLGLAPAAGGAVAGPWALPGIAVPKLPLVNIDPNVVKDGQTLFGFVPAGVTSDPTATGMQVAWINTATGKYGVTAMGKAGDTLITQYLANVPAGPLKTMAAGVLGNLVNALVPAGSRLAPVETGHGTVLSAVFGTVDNGGRSCFFLPMVGITNA